MDRRGFLMAAGGGMALGGPLLMGGGAAGAGGAIPAGYSRLRITEGEIAVEGKTGKAYQIVGDDGTHDGWRGYRDLRQE